MPFEEETLPWYKPEQFYPAHIGEILDSKYKIVGKLGYGAHSTVWLGRNIQDSAFVALKLCTRSDLPSDHRELDFYKHVSALSSQHPGQNYIRGLFDAFEIKSTTGQHLCLVQPPMHMTIRELQRQNPSRRLTKQILLLTLRNVLAALSFLHEEALVVHADLNPSNIMLTIDDESILTRFEEDEAENPSPIKIIDRGRTIYGSRKLRLPTDSLWGQPVLCDFGEARIGPVHCGLIQPELYRAPEVLFDMNWTTSVDIWNLAVLIWDLFEGKHLFHALDDETKSSATCHVAEMVAYLGLPPLDYIQQSPITSKVFDTNGDWKGAGNVCIPALSLEAAESLLDGQDKQQFLTFVRSMLTWLPEDRLRASELLKDPWLNDADSST